MYRLLFLFFIICCYWSCQNLNIQKPTAFHQGVSSDSIIYLKNSSFENGKTGHSILPTDWFHCVDENSPPDLHSSTSNYFEVRKEAMDGNQFVGMVVRKDETFENISQRLPRAFQKGTTYEMEFSLAKADKLMSASRVANRIVNFNRPVILQIWAGFNYCESNQLLHETLEINHRNWHTYNAAFTVDDNYEVITFEAYYSKEYPTLYNGHLLLDRISPIVRVAK